LGKSVFRFLKVGANWDLLKGGINRSKELCTQNPLICMLHLISKFSYTMLLPGALMHFK